MLRGSNAHKGNLVQLLEQFSHVADSSKHVSVCRDGFLQLSSFSLQIAEILRDVLDGSPPLQIIIPPLETQVQNAKQLINACITKSRFYLLLSCRTYAERIRTILGCFGQELLTILDGTEISLKSKETVRLLCKDLQSAKIRVSTSEEELMDEIELLCARNQGVSNSKHSNELLIKIATVAGLSTDPDSLRHEYKELEREKEVLELAKQEREAARFEQILALLSVADVLGCVIDKRKFYQDETRWFHGDELPPLQTFYCPITQDVMENPVEIESGHTFEMSAIQKWFAEGHRVCPVSNKQLEVLSTKPNRLLLQSIEEWKERNTMIKLTSKTSRLKSGDEREILEALIEIQNIFVERPAAKYWPIVDELISVLVNILKSSKRDLRRKTLATLQPLVADHSENKQKVCDAGAIECIVRSLARDVGEARQAVALLLELAKERRFCQQIAKVQGCILLLVTIVNSDNPHAVADGVELLKLLSDSDSNVIQMAESNYFKPLVQSLDRGSVESQALMANKLSEMPLSNQSRTALVEEGVLAPLVKMASSGNLECRTAAFGALRNISILSETRTPMIQAGVMQPLLDILFTTKSIAAIMREHAAATFANLSMSCQSSGIMDAWGNQRDIDECVPRFLSLLSITGPNIQSHLLKALSYISHHKNSENLRNALRAGGSIQLLVRFMDSTDNDVRTQALQLLYYLTKDGGSDMLAEQMAPDSYKTLVNIFSCEHLEEEKATAMGILGNLPLNNRQVTQRMLHAGVLSCIVTILGTYVSKVQGSINIPLVENATWTLVRFTLPTDVQLQQHTAGQGVIPLLVKLLKSGKPSIRSRAAMSLHQFSESTPKLSKQIKKPGGWLCFTPTPEPVCIVHGGLCSITESFCLLEADALPSLIKALNENDDETDDAVLSTLLTFVDEKCWEKGSDFIVNSNGVEPIIRKLTSENTDVQLKALTIMEKILSKEEHKKRFGNVAQVPLVSITQESKITATRAVAAKILAHLNILHPQSSYFY